MSNDDCVVQKDRDHPGSNPGDHRLLPSSPPPRGLSHANPLPSSSPHPHPHTTPPEAELRHLHIHELTTTIGGEEGLLGEQQEYVIGGEDAWERHNTTARPRAFFSSLRTASDERMSVNPAQQAADSLRRRSSESTTPASLTRSFENTPATRSRANTGRSPTEEQNQIIAVHARYNMANVDGYLPEDDGMRSLRQQLQEIKQLAVSTEEKAQRMHFLMTQDYLKHKSLLEPIPHDSPQQDGGLDNDGSLSPMLGAAAMPIDPKNPYNLAPGDLDPVFSPLPKNPRDVEGDLDEAMDDDIPELGCMHYKRNVKVQCFDCQRWFPCRHCHDQANDLPFQHSLNRKKTQNMLCMLCQTPQPAAEICTNCGEYAAWYYCPKCKLWDSDSNKRIYHCDDCGICRVGEGLGKDYVHCKRCNVCISISTSAAHPCIERATEGNCPLCLIALFESRTPVVSLPCGHYMHGDCYKDLMAVTYKCPVCSKSAVNMELQWRKLDEEIAIQPMPDEDEDLDEVMPHVEGQTGQDEQQAQAEMEEPRQRRPRQVWIGCNDCSSRSWTAFHWLGLKCQRCDSYNTNQMAPTAVHETEAERLMRQQQVHRHDFTGNAVLRDAGIGVEDRPEQFANSALEASNALEVPESPSQQAYLSSSPRLSSGAQSPGRYFVHDEEPRRPSFTTARFSTPSMPNLPTLSNLPDMPRMPRMPNLPNLPNLQNMRQNLPNMPNVELPRFSPYQMFDAVSRSLSPMRYYLQGLDTREEHEIIQRMRNRPTSVRSDPARSPTTTTMGLGSSSKLRTTSSGSEGVESADLWATSEEGEDEGQGGSDSDSIHALEAGEEDSSEDEDEGEESGEDDELVGDEGDADEGREELDIFGHR